MAPRDSGLSVLVYILVVIFNIAPWLGLAGVQLEMPLLVNRTPEAWALPSYITVMINSCKLTAVIFSLIKHFHGDRIPEAATIYFIVASSSACIFCLAFVWDITVMTNMTERSVPLLVLVSYLGVMDSLSLVVFLPYMAHFDSRYMSAFFVGNGMNRVILTVISRLQGVGESPECINRTLYLNSSSDMTMPTEVIAMYPDPAFSIRVFFILVSVIITFSGVSFTLLNYVSYFKKRRRTVNNRGAMVLSAKEGEALQDYNHMSENGGDKEDNKMLESGKAAESMSGSKGSTQSKTVHSTPHAKPWEYLVMCFLVGLGNCLWYAVVYSISSYAALPYGSKTYNLAVRLSMVANPLSAFFTLFVAPKSYWVSGAITAIATLCTTYLVVLASYSPHPPLEGTSAGEALVVSS